MTDVAETKVRDWLSVSNDTLQVRTGKVDIGQRISTALAAIVQQELTLPPEKIVVAPVQTESSPDEGMTSGSNSIEQSGHAIRLAAATLRALVLGHAADRFGGARQEWSVRDGVLTGPGINRPLPFLDIAGEISLDIAVDAKAELASAAKATSYLMRGMADLVSGSYHFIQDIEQPGMLHARVVRPPHARARLGDIDDRVWQRLKSEGFHLVRDGSFLAIAGPLEWPVMRAVSRLSRACEWRQEDGLPEGDIFASLTKDTAIGMPVVNGTPVEGEPVPERRWKPTHDARYERPFTMHGALGPSAAWASWDGTTLDITTHSQGIYILRDSIAESLEMAPEDVVLRYMPNAGCYGHNGADDAAFEAALVALALPDTPILLKWSREDEHGWEPYGPASAVELSAQVGEDGQIKAISLDAIGGTFRGRPRKGAGQAGPKKLLANHFRAKPLGPDPASPNMNWQGGLHRNLLPVYDFPQVACSKNLIVDMPLRTSALRCLGAALNIFAIESFLDEIAREHGEDPIGYRKAYVSDARALAVLDRLQAELETPVSSGEMGRGIAYAQYKNAMTRVAVSVDLSVSDAAEIKIDNIVMVADAGRIVDRDGLIAQLEGGALQAVSWALYEEVKWDRDGVTSRDWESYPVLRFSEVPEISTILLDRPDCQSVGAGEASPGPVLAAIGNAVYDAVGLRMRRLPMTPEAITKVAMDA